MSRVCLALVLFVSAASQVSKAEDPTATFLSYTGNDLFPSFIIATATVDWNGDEQRAEDKKTDSDPELEDGEIPLFGDENGSIGVELENIPEGAEILVEISGDGFLKKSKWEGESDDDFDVVHIYPKARWDYEALRNCEQQKPANLKIKVTIDGEVIADINETVILRSVNDCPFYVKLDDEGEDVEDISVTFAAYVNENHPWIDGLLKEALDSVKDQELLNGFTGYQSGSQDEVMAQVFAVWNALQRRGIKYSDVSTSSPSKFVYSQTVRFLDDTVKATQANCVDGSVLMASILRRIGLDAYLVMVPGHCFLAFSDGDEENPTIFGLETTLLGSDNLKPVTELSKLPAKLKNKEFEASNATFNSALESGKKLIEEHSEAFRSNNDPNTQFISITQARQMGVMPLGASKDKTK